MATYTDAEMLEAVREAIRGNIEKLQSYVTGTGRSARRYSLSELLALEKYYTARVAAAEKDVTKPTVIKFAEPSTSE